MNPNILPSDRFSVEDVINPQSLAAAGTVASAWIPMAQIGYLCAIISVGAIATGGTLDAAFTQATDASGTDAKALSPAKAITQFADVTNDNNQAIINVSESDLDIANNFTHVRLTLTAAVEASLVAAVLLGFDANYFPKAHDTSVVEVV